MGIKNFLKLYLLSHDLWAIQILHFYVHNIWLLAVMSIIFKDKVHFWPSNSCLGLVLAIELQNRVSLTTQLRKLFIFSPSGCFGGRFRWRGRHMAVGPICQHHLPLLSLFSSPSPLSFFCHFAIFPWNQVFKLRIGPWADLGGEQRNLGRIPAIFLAGGEV